MTSLSELQRSVRNLIESDEYDAPVNPRIPPYDLREEVLSSLDTNESDVEDAVHRESLLEVGEGLANLTISVLTMAVIHGLDLEPLVKEILEKDRPNIGAAINKQTRQEITDPTVYDAQNVPITFGIGGPKVGEGVVTMDTYGNMMVEGVITDTDFLPQIEEVSIEDLSIYIGEKPVASTV